MSPKSEPVWVNDLDPGVKLLVQELNRSGFETCDSGDGVSKKGQEGALDWPNVAIRTVPARLIETTTALKCWLEEHHVAVAPGMIQASYDPADGIAIVLLFHVDSAMLIRGGTIRGGRIRR